MREVGIGIAGFGTVGGGVLSILKSHAREIEARLGARIVVRRVAVRDPAKERMVDVPRALLTTRYQDLLDDPQIAVVVELVGGTTEAYDLVVGALQRGKHVVTANKALLAFRGDDVFRIAQEKGVDVYYEGAVCGGVPVIRTLREALASDRIQALHGIVNGTTNFILTAMTERGEPLNVALAEAQRLGYAEADPTLDVSGGDAAQKLCVLAQLAFGARIKPEDVLTEGILGLLPEDFAWGREAGYALKLLAVARRCGPHGGPGRHQSSRHHPRRRHRPAHRHLRPRRRRHQHRRRLLRPGPQHPLPHRPRREHRPDDPSARWILLHRRCHGQVRAGPPARLAAGCDGGANHNQRPYPRCDHGQRWRLPHG